MKNTYRKRPVTDSASVAASHRATGTTADQLVTAVIPSLLPSSGHETQTLPVADLAALPADGSMRYGLAALDHRGRLADSALVQALGWRPHDRLDIRVASDVLIIHADAGGIYELTSRGHIRIPAAARRWCGLATGDRVLLAAAAELGILVVHTMAVLDAMVLGYHRQLLGGEAQ